jgi:predicted O-methyltransferase YrrM
MSSMRDAAPRPVRSLGGRALRRLRTEWERNRPLPKPRYIPNTPRVENRTELDVYFPPNGPTLGAAALSPKATESVCEILSRLTPTQQIQDQLLFYGWGQGKFGEHWRFADITTTLAAATTFVQPTTYLEIGVRRGRSSAVVGALSPRCAIYGFDLWIPGYGESENPGPDFVRQELRKAGHQGEVTLIAGDSRETVPSFLAQHADLFFDLITVDGDHSVMGAAADLANTLPRLKVGGIMVFDDICSAPLLLRTWERLVMRDTRYLTWEFTEAGYGIAAAIRISDEPLIGGFG